MLGNEVGRFGIVVFVLEGISSWSADPQRLALILSFDVVSFRRSCILDRRGRGLFCNTRETSGACWGEKSADRGAFAKLDSLIGGIVRELWKAELLVNISTFYQHRAERNLIPATWATVLGDFFNRPGLYCLLSTISFECSRVAFRTGFVGYWLCWR